MADSADEHPAWAPLDGFPSGPEFYRRVLEHLPSPLMVVNSAGNVIYANQAMFTLGGWTELPDSDTTIANFIDPEDAGETIEAFAEIIDSPQARVLGGGQPWSEIYLRVVRADGSTLPVEIVGSGGLRDEAVAGIIYEVRPAWTRNLLGRVLDGLSQGASMHHLLSLVAEMIASPPLDLDAVILQSAPDGTHYLAASTSPLLTDVASFLNDHVPWESSAKRPGYLPVASLPASSENRLGESEFQDLWHVSVESPLTPTTLRIIAVSPTRHVPSKGSLSRIIQGRELAAAVLLRSQSDVLLEYAAGQDLLTGLPNRAAFYQAVESIEPTQLRAALHLDLDGLRQVNDELGQATGDAVLRVVADRLRSMCRTKDVVGRLGDDEFSIVLAPVDDLPDPSDRAITLATAMLEAIRDTIVVAGRTLALSTSIGVAVAGPGVSTDHLLTWAEAAMHDAKRSGGGRICRFGVGFG